MQTKITVQSSNLYQFFILTSSMNYNFTNMTPEEKFEILMICYFQKAELAKFIYVAMKRRWAFKN